VQLTTVFCATIPELINTTPCLVHRYSSAIGMNFTHDPLFAPLRIYLHLRKSHVAIESIEQVRHQPPANTIIEGCCHPDRPFRPCANSPLHLLPMWSPSRKDACRYRQFYAANEAMYREIIRCTATDVRCKRTLLLARPILRKRHTMLFSHGLLDEDVGDVWQPRPNL